MDLATITPKGRWVELTYPGTKNNVGLSVYVESQYSAEAQTKQTELAQLRAAGEDVTNQRLFNEVAIAAVTDWKWAKNADFDGQKLECTPENKQKVFSDDRLFFVEQVRNEVFNVKSFFTG